MLISLSLCCQVFQTKRKRQRLFAAIGFGILLLIDGSSVSAQIPVPPAVANGSISGVVTDDSGVLLAGATVYYNNSPKKLIDTYGHRRLAEPLISAKVVTAKDGSFTLNGLRPSVYWLCVEGISATQLRSCEWGAPAKRIDLTAASSVPNVNFQLAEGVTLTFRVSDSANKIVDFPGTTALPRNPSVAKPGNFRIYVVDAGRYMAARPSGVSGSTREYNITVPKTRALRLLVDSTLNVVDLSASAITPRTLARAITIAGQAVTYGLMVQ